MQFISCRIEGKRYVLIICILLSLFKYILLYLLYHIIALSTIIAHTLNTTFNVSKEFFLLKQSRCFENAAPNLYVFTQQDD